MKRLYTLVYLLVLITGTVHAAPAAQSVAVDVPPWAAVGGGAALVAWVLVSLINRSPKNGNDALVKLADNQAEAIKLDRERFEAQQIENKERNANVARMLAMSEKDHERMHNNEAAQMRMTADQIKVTAEEAAAKLKLAESITAMNAEDNRHNQELETRMSAIEASMKEVKRDVSAVKVSVGPNAAVKLAAVETTLSRLSTEFHALVTAIKEAKPTLEVTEVTHAEIKIDTVTASLPAAGDVASAGAIDAGAGFDTAADAGSNAQ